MSEPKPEIKPIFEYQGVGYNRPCSRGIVLSDMDRHFDECIPECDDLVFEIKVWIKNKNE